MFKNYSTCRYMCIISTVYVIVSCNNKTVSYRSRFHTTTLYHTYIHVYVIYITKQVHAQILQTYTRRITLIQHEISTRLTM